MTNTIKITQNVFVVVKISTLSDTVLGFALPVPMRNYPYVDTDNKEKHILKRASQACKEYGFQGFEL